LFEFLAVVAVIAAVSGYLVFGRADYTGAQDATSIAAAPDGQQDPAQPGSADAQSQDALAPTEAAPAPVNENPAPAPAAPGTGAFAAATTVVRSNEPLPVTPVTTTFSAGDAGYSVIDGIASFQTPTKQIICRMNADSARCDANPSGLGYGLPPASEACSGTWGAAVLIPTADAQGEWACGPATWTESADPTLGYGTAISFGALTCASQEVGVTCLGPNHHGFRYSRFDGATLY
jgi:hypothetical protein